MRWTHQLLSRTHPWPYRDGVGPGIVERQPRRCVAAPPVVARATRAVVLTFPCPLALTLAFVTVVGGWGRRGRGCRRTW
jgi:hypothetical protein